MTIYTILLPVLLTRIPYGILLGGAQSNLLIRPVYKKEKQTRLAFTVHQYERERER